MRLRVRDRAAPDSAGAARGGRDQRPDRKPHGDRAARAAHGSRSSRPRPTSGTWSRPAGAASSIPTRSFACSRLARNGSGHAPPPRSRPGASRSTTSIPGVGQPRAVPVAGPTVRAQTERRRLRHHHHADREAARGHGARAASSPTRRAAWARSAPRSATASWRRIDLAERLALPVEWVPVSSGARIAMDSGTENLDATARVVRRIVTFTRRGGVIHVIVVGRERRRAELLGRARHHAACTRAAC